MPLSHDTPSLTRCRVLQQPWHSHAVGRRLIFLHIPKTAGTAITAFLRQQFADDDVMPQLQANFHLSHPLWPLVARRYQLLGVGMHLDHDRVAALARGLRHEPPPFLFTVLREPRARLYSRYKEWRSTSDEHMQAARDHVQEAILTARTKPFSEFIRSENPVVISTLDNLQARLLAGLNISRGLSDAEVLNRARCNLAAYDLIGTTSSCDETVRLLADAYGWPKPAAAPRVHVSQPIPAEALACTEEDEERIAAFTALDQQLWDELVHSQLPLTDCAENVATSQPESLAAADLSGLRDAIPRPPHPLLLDRHVATDAPQTAVDSGSESLGPGYTTVQSVIARVAPDRVIGLGRKKWFPGPNDDPQPLAGDERLVVVVRMTALSHQRSYLLRQAALIPGSLLAITEVDPSDPRLKALLRCPATSPFCQLEGIGPDAVLVIAFGALRDAHGGLQLDAFVEMLERCSSTHPTALRLLQDSLPARMLALLELELCLAAVASWLEGASVVATEVAMLGSLRPEDSDPLLPNAPGHRAPLAHFWAILQAAKAKTSTRFSSVDLAVLAEVDAALHNSPMLLDPPQDATLEHILCCLKAVFRLLSCLLDDPPLD